MVTFLTLIILSYAFAEARHGVYHICLPPFRCFRRAVFEFPLSTTARAGVVTPLFSLRL